MAKLITINDIDQAVKSLKNGGIVAFLTDTVYGLSCRIDDEKLQKRMKEVKGRDKSKPFPVVISSIEQCEKLVALNDRDRLLIKHFWPGEITFIFNKRDDVDGYISNYKSTMALRMLSDPVIFEMIKEVECPLFLTSANLSNEPVCTSGQEVMDRIGDKIDIVIDGKPNGNVASTILDCSNENLKIIRQGKITIEDINKILKEGGLL
ncbi:MAG: L-threonylcarbamoyladenylate synthase [Anaerorhabdus sp.]